MTASWADFESADPDLAGAVRRLWQQWGLMYLATARADGSPRVHPVGPILADGGLFVVTRPDSPKARDLERDGRYVLHCLPGERDEECLLRGRARRYDQARPLVTSAASHAIDAGDRIFEFSIDRADHGWWEKVGEPDTFQVRRRWLADATATPSHSDDRAEERRASAERAFQGEVLGDALFATLAEQQTDTGRRRDLEALRLLELQTGAVLADLVTSIGGTPTPTEKSRERGRRMAEAAGALTWRDFLKTFEPTTTAALARYRRLRELVNDEQRATVDDVIAHEEALQAYAEASLAGAPHPAAAAIARLREPWRSMMPGPPSEARSD